MSQSINPLSRGIRLPEYSLGRPRYNFRWNFGYLFMVYSQDYRETMRERVFKDLGQQAADMDTVQKLLDNRKDFTGCNN